MSMLTNPPPWLLEIMGALPPIAGVNVTPANAQECAAVRAAVSAVAEPLGQLPIHVFKRGKDGSKERDGSHALQRILHDRANDWTSSAEFRESLTRDACLYGNGYAWIEREDDVPVALYRLDPAKMKVEADALGGPVYTFTDEGEETVYERADILHIRAPSSDGLVGDSPVHLARESIALAMVMEQHASRMFRNGGRPSGVLKFKGKLGDDVAGRVKASWEAANAGDGSGGTAVLEEDASFESIALNSVDSQFLEMRRFAIEEIARIWRVPPIFLQDYGRATWSNSESQGYQLVTYCLMAWIKRWEGEIRLKLFSEDEAETHFAEYLTDDLLRGSTAERMAAYSTAIASRILSPNEARASENRPPYAGGDEFINPNTTPMTNPADAPEKEEA